MQLNFGFMDNPDVPQALADAAGLGTDAAPGLALNPTELSGRPKCKAALPACRLMATNRPLASREPSPCKPLPAMGTRVSRLRK